MRPFYRFAYKIVEAINVNFLHARIDGGENIPNGGCLVVCNHVSFLDPTTAGWAMQRECFYLARKTLFKPPVLDWLLPLCNVTPIDRDGADLGAMRRVIQMLQSGKTVVLFPEGTRSPDGKLLPAQPGAGFIASKAGVPILPVRLFGTFESFPRQRQFPRFFPMRIAIGKPFLPESATSKKDYDEIARRMMAEIAALK